MTPDATVDHVLESVAPDAGVDRSVLAGLLRKRPHPRAIVPLLSAAAAETVCAAVVYLGCHGSARECPLLAQCLQHEDDSVARLAEYCLWSLWMQGGTERGNRRLAEAIGCIRDGDYAAAVDLLTVLVAEEPFFAEAYFQRGLALCLAGRQEEAARTHRHALRLNPHHFGAAAALGHACVAQGNLPGALYYYRRALRIHPRLEAVPDAIRELEAVVGPAW